MDGFLQAYFYIGVDTYVSESTSQGMQLIDASGLLFVSLRFCKCTCMCVDVFQVQLTCFHVRPHVLSGVFLIWVLSCLAHFPCVCCL